MKELKPCPFCGAKESEYGAPVSLWAACTTSGDVEYLIKCERCGAERFGKTAEEAQEAWNGREWRVACRRRRKTNNAVPEVFELGQMDEDQKKAFFEKLKKSND